MQQGSTGPRLSDPRRPRPNSLQQACHLHRVSPAIRQTFPLRNVSCARENVRPVAKAVVPNVATDVPSAQRGARSIVSEPVSAALAPYRRTNTLRPPSEPSRRLPASQSLPSESVATPPRCARIDLSFPHVRRHTGAAVALRLSAEMPPPRICAPTSSRECVRAIDTAPSYGIATPGRRDHFELPPAPNRSIVSAPGGVVSPFECLVADHPAA